MGATRAHKEICPTARAAAESKAWVEDLAAAGAREIKQLPETAGNGYGAQEAAAES
jgi:hypothetical protein